MIEITQYTAARRFSLVMVVACLFSTSACQSVAPNRFSISNVTTIDAVNGVQHARTVIIEDGTILNVVAADQVDSNIRSIDGSGKFLIPGLWDMHVHLTYDPRLTAAMPDLFLRYGVTSVRDTGGLMSNMLPVIRSMRETDAIAPRVFFSGPLMDGSDVVYDGNSVPEIGIRNNSAETAVDNVHALKAAGVDFIKIYEMVSPEVFVAIAEAAADHGMPVTAHVPLSMNASSVAPYVGSLEHLRNIELECASNADDLLQARRNRLQNPDAQSGIALRSQMHRDQRLPAVDAMDDTRCDAVIASLRGVIQVPTAGLNTLSIDAPWTRNDWSDAVANLPKALRDEWQTAPSWYANDPADRDTRFADYVLEMIGRMHRAGVPVGAGTDTPIGRALPGDSLHTEMEVLVKAGLTPLEALESATLRPAEFFGLESKMGSIAAGMSADLVLLDADPLLDITNSRAISAVIYRGKRYQPGPQDDD